MNDIHDTIDSSALPANGERRRYIAQTHLPEFGEQGQSRIARGKICIVGCGALGSVVAMYTAGAGIGMIRLVDFDTVDLSNLQRQVFFTEGECGKPKAELLRTRIEALNHNVRVETVIKAATTGIAAELFRDVDFIVDCADNPSTTYLIAEQSRLHHIPYCTAGVSGWIAQIMTSDGLETPGFEEIVSRPDDPSLLPCQIAGTWGPLTGVIGALQASEALKTIAQTGDCLTSRMLYIDLLQMNFTEFRI